MKTNAFLTRSLLSGLYLLLLSMSGMSYGQDILTAEERQWLADQPVIRFAPAPNYPPVEFFDDNNEYQGITADFIRIIDQKFNFGLKLEIVQLKSWGEVVSAGRAREVDMWGAAEQTPARSQYMQFTRPYIRLPAVIIVRNEFVGEGIEALEGKQVVGIDNYASYEHLQEHYPQLNTMAVPDIETGLRMVSYGSADAIVASNAAAIYYIERNGLTNLKVIGESGFEWNLRFAVRDDWAPLLSIMQKGLDGITAQQKRDIYRYWINLDSVEDGAFSQNGRYITLAGVLVAILLVLLGWCVRRKSKLKMQLLTQRLEEQKQIEQELKNLATTDALTGTYNRRAILEMAHVDHAKCLAEGQPFSVLLMDIDHFKQVNDQYGHEVGDRVIKAVVDVCSEVLQVKSLGHIGRFGGEEFVILLPNTDQAAASILAEQLRERVEREPIQCVKNAWHSATVSIGLASQDSYETFDELLNRADLAMYEAKKAGRNQVAISQELVAG
ncbi:diguanylate cyclase [Marinomonas ostreistagni]|uniref:transporter substrate-binding domain-containing diguanylate cyclase n=1 Tax=Marinomonas ostreistagni TaxID=359209 RepID=UPI0019529F65|nr:diguanylate cyclase [Marinomonas ostreistagni]MBM6550755.1 diguanylate cyclase [Marinomonas ostreistagni]